MKTVIIQKGSSVNYTPSGSNFHCIFLQPADESASQNISGLPSGCGTAWRIIQFSNVIGLQFLVSTNEKVWRRIHWGSSWFMDWVLM